MSARSHNEVAVLLRKAAIGAGLQTGLADDCAQGGLWLCERGLDGVLAVVSAARPARPATIRHTGDCVEFANGWAAISGVSAIDFLQAGCVEALLRQCDVPLMLVGLAGIAARDQGTRFHLSCPPHGDVVVTGSRFDGDIAYLQTGCDIVMRMEADSGADAASGNTGHVEVDDASWARALELASRTYVPESDLSRAQGAGAGAIDND